MKNSDKATCGDYGGTSKQSGKPCERVAGWGTEFEEGKCSYHRGTNADGSSHEGNTNSVSHGAYADQSSLYNDVFDDSQRELADAIFQDYLERYEERHGDPPMGFRVRLFKLSVNAVTEMRVEQWVENKPRDVDTGTTHINRSVKKSPQGEDYYEYKKSPALAAMKHLSDQNRKWLKSLELLPDGDNQVVDAVESLATLLSE